jgi:hypothetical protein
MCNLDNLFCKVGDKFIEGYLSDEAKKDCKILFVLREPHATAKDTTGFWIYEVVNDSRTDGKRYVNVLGMLAAKLLKEPQEEQEDELKYYKRMLKKCAFINLYPFSGDNKKSKNYTETLYALKDAEKKPEVLKREVDEEKYCKIAGNRLEIINELKPRYIVTACDIFDAFKDKLGTAPQKGLRYKDKQFNAIDMDNETKVLAFYHPSYTRIAYDSLMDAKLMWEDTLS